MIPSTSRLSGVLLVAGAIAAHLAAAEDPAWTPLFDGKSLDGWKAEGGKATYRVEDGAIVGTTVEGSPNTFLCKGNYGDFELEFEVKCNPALNSGVQVRSHIYAQDGPDPLDPSKKRTKGVVYGPQCEIARHETGTAGRFYDESRRDKWICELQPDAGTAFKDSDWNKYRVVIQGNHNQSYDNGVKCADFTDEVDHSGLIGLQVHGISKGEGPYEVRWRNIRIRPLKAQ
jgi:hypothetical protein